MGQLFPKAVGDGTPGEAGPPGKPGGRGPAGPSGIARVARFSVAAADVADGAWTDAVLTAISDPDGILQANELRPPSGTYLIHFNLTVSGDAGGTEQRAARLMLDAGLVCEDSRSGIGEDGTTPQAGTTTPVLDGEALTLQVTHSTTGETVDFAGVLSIYGS